jgi:exodeoxyribonuclease VII large subunit
VAEVAELIRQTLEEGVPSPLRVVGEIGALSQRQHWYFTLKDEQAVLSCVAWASSAARFGFTPREGDEVLAVGHVSHYAPQGRTQFYVTRLEPVGAGALAARFRAMCEELRRLGYFDDARKKPIPTFPRRVAVVTSRHGAALQDVVDTARRRCPAVELLVVDVRVQGDGAAEEIARAIRWIDRNASHLGIDAMLVTRGGGSIEDLWAFNERIVADAVMGASIPVVAAIGHESDTTVIELVADLRAATPTQATMRLLPDAAALREQLQHLHARLGLLARRRIERGRERLEAAARQELLRRPQVILGRLRERLELMARAGRLALRDRLSRESRRLDQATSRLELHRPTTALASAHGALGFRQARLLGAMRATLERCQSRVDLLDRQRQALDPASVLRRGYSLTQRADGSLVRSVGEVSPQERLWTQVADGTIESVVVRAGGSRGESSPEA